MSTDDVKSCQNASNSEEPVKHESRKRKPSGTYHCGKNTISCGLFYEKYTTYISSRKHSVTFAASVVVLCIFLELFLACLVDSEEDSSDESSDTIQRCSKSSGTFIREWNMS